MFFAINHKTIVELCSEPAFGFKISNRPFIFGQPIVYALLFFVNTGNGVRVGQTISNSSELKSEIIEFSKL